MEIIEEKKSNKINRLMKCFKGGKKITTTLK